MLYWKASLSLSISSSPSGKKHNKTDGIDETGECFVSTSVTLCDSNFEIIFPYLKGSHKEESRAHFTPKMFEVNRDMF